jgi:hypothetical protein
MRSAFLSLVLGLSVLAGISLAQQETLRGRVTSFDAAKGVATIMTPDGKEVACMLTPQTMIKDVNNQDIANFKQQGLPAGTTVMFRVKENSGHTELVGLKVAGQPAGQKGDGQRPGAPQPPAPRDSIGVKPLTELGNEKYKGETGGLYGGGSNEPPPSQHQAAKKAVAKIQPLDAQGKPSASGKIGLLSVGMSNTTQEFSVFKRMADSDPQKSDKVVVVDGAQGGQASEQWVDPSSETGKRVWGTVDQRLKAADVSPEQVQVVWIKQALIQQGRFGEFPAHAKKLQSDLTAILQQLKRHFPNLQLAYLSSRIYAGYATTALNPEPYAYEGAFSVRWVIDSQVKGEAMLNYDSARGEVNAPVVLWGPYLWGDGTTPRKDGVVWNKDDLTDRDGTHPSESGRQKVAEMLMKFFHSDPYAKSWYLKN